MDGRLPQLDATKGHGFADLDAEQRARHKKRDEIAH
jgi:hypothetical protein